MTKKQDVKSALIEFKTISKKERKSLGITKKNFVEDFLKEIKVVRKQMRRRKK